MVIITQQYLNTDNNMTLLTLLRECDSIFVGRKQPRTELFSETEKPSSAKYTSRLADDRRLCIRYPSFLTPHSQNGVSFDSHCSLPRIATAENRTKNSLLKQTYRKEQKWKSKHHKVDVAEEPEELYRISMPCTTGCCYCVYANRMGPVRVYVSAYTPPRKERTIQGIRDGKGRRVIATSRRNDIKGLVYDQQSFSLHPPLKTNKGFWKVGQRTTSSKDMKVCRKWNRHLRKS